MKTEIKGFSNIKATNTKAPAKESELNLVFLDQNYATSFQEQDKAKSLLLNKNFLLFSLILCLASSFICLQIEYGFLKSFLILGAFILAFKGLVWSWKELKNYLSAA